MHKNLIRTGLALLILCLISSYGFAKENVKDKDSKKKTTVVTKQQVEKTATVTKDSSKKTETPAPTTTTPAITTTTQAQTIDDLKKTIDLLPRTTQSMSGEQIKWQVISSGGVSGSSTNYMMSGTVGQTAVGLSTSTNYKLNSGFWQDFSAGGGCCIGIRGNVEGDASENIDISDLVFLVDFMFTGGPAPLCDTEANIDADAGGNIDISDLVYLVDFMFTGGPPPPSC